MHTRLIPKRNAFKYGIYYIALPLSKLAENNIAQERFALSSFYNIDHGPLDGSPLLPWAREILDNYGITEASGDITLICMPRILGYVFNPISFWLCYDKEENIRAIICEVHNTYGEQHSYICAREDHQPITDKDHLTAHKLFHVSPFLECEGNYEFSFNINNEKFGAWIDYFDASGQKTLITSLTGDFSDLTAASLNSAFWKYPLVTIKAVILIHWQAVKIIAKGIKHIKRPQQKAQRVSATRNITNI
jgi:DUF1365 family protein